MARKPSPAQAREAATRIVRTLRAAGHVAYFAGGCVRDGLLGLAPTDYDVATDATPERIRALFPRTAEVGAAFGVVLVREAGTPGGPSATIEVATFRAEGPYSDRRRPDSVRFADPLSDARRRDFTINAIFLDPLAEPDPEAPSPAGVNPTGHIIDYVGGVEDLQRGVLRAVGNPDERLAEDHLRALRAVRFAARLGFTLDPATAAAIREHARELAGVSRERIGDELRRMMAHPSRARAAALLQELLLDEPVLTEPHLDVPTPTLAALGPDALYPTCLAAWAADRAGELDAAAIEGVVARWRTALCLSNEERADLLAVLRGLALLRGPWLTSPVAAQKRAAAHSAPGGWFDQALVLLGATDADRAAAVRARVAELAATPSGLAPAPLVDGEDLIAAGLRPGPAFKQLLDRLYDAQLEDRVRTREEALELAGRSGV